MDTNIRCALVSLEPNPGADIAAGKEIWGQLENLKMNSLLHE